jgi:hypothetical protein
MYGFTCSSVPVVGESCVRVGARTSPLRVPDLNCGERGHNGGGRGCRPFQTEDPPSQRPGLRRRCRRRQPPGLWRVHNLGTAPGLTVECRSPQELHKLLAVVAQARCGRAGVVSWAARDVCKARRMWKLGGARTVSSSRRATAAVLRQRSSGERRGDMRLLDLARAAVSERPCRPRSTTGATVSVGDAPLSLRPSERPTYGMQRDCSDREGAVFEEPEGASTGSYRTVSAMRPPHPAWLLCAAGGNAERAQAADAKGHRSDRGLIAVVWTPSRSELPAGAGRSRLARSTARD